jgi:transcription initiation factor IIF auxiliary subunit
MERKIKMKISYFIKRKRRSNEKGQTSSTQKKVKNIGRTKPKKKKNKLARHKLAIKHDVLNSKNCLKIRQLHDNSSQPSLEPLNFTVYIASEINDNSSKVSDFHFQIGTLMSKDHAPEQKLLVLFRAPGPQRPPGTDYQQSPN